MNGCALLGENLERTIWAPKGVELRHNYPDPFGFLLTGKILWP